LRRSPPAGATFSSASCDRSFCISSKASAVATAVVTGPGHVLEDRHVVWRERQRCRAANHHRGNEFIAHRQGQQHRALGPRARHPGPGETRVRPDVVEDQRLAVALHRVAQEGGMLPSVPRGTGCFREPPHVGVLALPGPPRSAAEVDRASPDRRGFVGDHADQIDRHEVLERAGHGIQHARQVAARVRRLRHRQERLVLRLPRPPTVLHGSNK
jgi:hypothetical protein